MIQYIFLATPRGRVPTMLGRRKIEAAILVQGLEGGSSTANSLNEIISDSPNPKLLPPTDMCDFSLIQQLGSKCDSHTAGREVGYQILAIHRFYLWEHADRNNLRDCVRPDYFYTLNQTATPSILAMTQCASLTKLVLLLYILLLYPTNKSSGYLSLMLARFLVVFNQFVAYVHVQDFPIRIILNSYTVINQQPWVS